MSGLTREELLDNICPSKAIYECKANSCSGCHKMLNRCLDEYDVNIRNKVIDEFVKLLKEEYPIAKYPDDNGTYQNELLNDDIDDIAKRMKEKNNER